MKHVTQDKIQDISDTSKVMTLTEGLKKFESFSPYSSEKILDDLFSKNVKEYNKEYIILRAVELLNYVKNKQYEELAWAMKQYGKETILEYEKVLTTACTYFDSDKCLNYLIDMGINYQKDNENILILAIEHNAIEVVKVLLEKGSDVSVNDHFPIRWASYFDRFEIAQMLVEQGSDISHLHHSAVAYASQNASYTTLEYLLSMGADIEIAKREADIHVATWINSWELKNKLDKNMQNSYSEKANKPKI